MIRIDSVIDQTFIRQADWFDSIDSTNTFLLQSDGEGKLLPYLVGANEQIQGRGRGVKRWWSQQGALTFSLLVSPMQWGVPPEKWPLMGLATGLAMSQAVSGRVPGADVRIKWPNDVYLDGKKVCGILLETHPSQSGAVVVGIGLNVNNSLIGAPEEIRGTATSLVDETGSLHDRTDVLVSVLQQLELEFTHLAEDSAGMIQRIRERCYLTGRFITVSEAGADVSGTCQGVDDDGALRLLTEHGPQRVLAGLITLN